MSTANSMEADVIQHLASAGWTPLKREVAIASKDFDTAVGTKTALVYFFKSGALVDAMLTGNYQSEGRNILDPLPRIIPKAATADQIKTLVQAFILDIETRVDESYARKLFLNKEQERETSA